MAKQVISLGSTPNGAGGDDRRSAWLKGKSNFTELFNFLSGRSDGDDTATSLPAALPVTKGGTGGGTPAAARTGLQLGTAAIANVGVGSGQVLAVPMLGLGSRAAVNNSSIMPNMNVYESSFGVIGDSTIFRPVPFGVCLNLAFPGTAYLGAQLYMGTSPGGVIGFRSGDYSGSSPGGSFNTIYHTGNTTRSADGTLKAI